MIIAEVKTHSPFGFQSDYTWDELFDVANSVGDMLSIHTDERWGGSLDLIRRARAYSDLPILAKGIHATDKQIEDALEAGADKVLVVNRLPDNWLDHIFYEPVSALSLRQVPISVPVVWNQRDLRSGNWKYAAFESARQNFDGWLCQASFIHTIDDVDPTADACLVGEHLIEFAESLKTASQVETGVLY